MLKTEKPIYNIAEVVLRVIGVWYNGIMSGSNPEDVGSIPTAPVFGKLAQFGRALD